MNRVMMWNGISEFLMIVAPLVDLARLQSRVTKFLFPKYSAQALEDGADHTCGLCSASRMVLPVRTQCGHAFCYYCLSSEMLENPKGCRCPRCGIELKSFDHA
jgi:peroxin-2